MAVGKACAVQARRPQISRHTQKAECGHVQPLVLGYRTLEHLGQPVLPSSEAQMQ